MTFEPFDSALAAIEKLISIPFSDELKEVESYVGDIREDSRAAAVIEELESRIANFESLSQALLHAKRRVEIRAGRLKNRRSHISSIPYEILAYIFLLGVKSKSEDEEETKEVYLFTITSTISTWRHVALSSTELWTSIRLEWPAEQQSVWLERSGERMVDVLYFGGVSGPRSSQPLYYNTGRWRSLIIHNPGPGFLVGLTTLLTVPYFAKFTSIETLEIIDEYAHDVLAPVSHLLVPISDASIDPDLSSAPGALRCLRLANVECTGIEDAVYCVTTLELRSVSMMFLQNWHSLFRQAVSVETLILSQLKHPCSVEDLSLNGNFIGSKAHLRTLTLGRHNGKSFLRLLLHEMQAPNLEKFSIVLPRCNHEYAEEFVRRLRSFLQSSPEIQELEIIHNYQADIAVMVLQMLSEPINAGHTFSRTNVLLPKLRTFKIAFTSYYPSGLLGHLLEFRVRSLHTSNGQAADDKGGRALDRLVLTNNIEHNELITSILPYVNSVHFESQDLAGSDADLWSDTSLEDGELDDEMDDEEGGFDLGEEWIQNALFF